MARPRRAREECCSTSTFKPWLVISSSASCKPEHHHQPTTPLILIAVPPSSPSAPPLCASFHSLWLLRPHFDPDKAAESRLVVFWCFIPPSPTPSRFFHSRAAWPFLKRSLAKGTAPRSNSPHFRRPIHRSTPPITPLIYCQTLVFTGPYRVEAAVLTPLKRMETGEMWTQASRALRSRSKSCCPNRYVALIHAARRDASGTRAAFNQKFHTPLLCDLSVLVKMCSNTGAQRLVCALCPPSSMLG